MTNVWVKILGAMVLVIAIFVLNSRALFAKQAIDFKNNSCHALTNLKEKTGGIPQNLLTSISLAETGRWNPEKREMFAWPWTVTWGGKGHYYPTKQVAIDIVNKLQDAGIKNIDVGCMQINMVYHPNAFKNLEEAFNPESNIEYARRFLTGLHKSTGSWIQAAANYHSTSPRLNLNYQTKILKIWREVSGVSQIDLPLEPSREKAQHNFNPGLAQMKLMNARFRARLEAERGEKRHIKVRNQLEAWRKSRSSPNLLAHTAALHRANLMRRQKSNLNKTKISFADKRRQQLSNWRQDRYYFQR